jgi:O-acetyl-ADP-ribose deacetylase (regulator of RNase III)
MIKLKKGNLLEVNAEALVNTVNCVGVMGKGIALQFKQAFPDNFKVYERACKKGEVNLGKVFLYETSSIVNPKYIINFPTKRHWKGRSKLEDIHSGLNDLVKIIRKLGISSIAIPPLGCGYGGLSWPEVKALISKAFVELQQVEVLVFEPTGAPSAEKMPVKTGQPNMTLSRALLIKLLQYYALPGYRLTLLEVQKLAYFLQAAGQPLRLNFNRHKYGPYSENLNFVLQRMEGHFIRGYGDRSQGARIHLMSGASNVADTVLKSEPNSKGLLKKVTRLIEGFETPYGMELLASVHWVSTKESPQAQNSQEAIEKVLSWSRRKKEKFSPIHIEKAWTKLSEQRWIEQK